MSQTQQPTHVLSVVSTIKAWVLSSDYVAINVIKSNQHINQFVTCSIIWTIRGFGAGLQSRAQP